MYYFSKEVYMVYGACNSAIYDFRNNKLFSFSSEATKLINKITTCKCELNEKEREFLERILSFGLLTKEKIEHHSILELKQKPKIDFAWIEITNKCNLKCIHCYEESSPMCNKVMEFDAFCHIVNELCLLNVKKIQLIGGEPFIIGDDLYRYLDYCVGKFDFIEIFTNGTLINDKWVDYLNKHSIKIALSVYSYNENEHNKVTTSKSFKSTIECIKKLKAKNIKYRVSNVIMNDIDLGEKNTNLFTLNPNKDIVRMSGRAKLQLLNPDLIKRKLITKERFSYPIDKEFCINAISGHNCFSRKLYFSAELKVFPCVMERNLCHGIIDNNKNLFELINEDIQLLNKEKIETCCDCEFRYCCHDCRPDSIDGSILKKPWYCTYNPYKGEFIDSDTFINYIVDEYDIK